MSKIEKSKLDKLHSIEKEIFNIMIFQLKAIINMKNHSYGFLEDLLGNIDIFNLFFKNYFFRDPNLFLVEAPALATAEIIMDPQQVYFLL